jgi:hypothetical protein
VIIPDRGWLSPELKSRLTAYLNTGGRVLFSHEATLDGGEFQLPQSPVAYASKCPYTPSYMRLGTDLGSGLPDTEYVNYRDGSYVKPATGAESFGEVWQPYFNRAPEHFSSHAQTPADKPTGHPVAALGPDARIAYLFAAAFRGYREDAFYIYKEIVGRLLAKLLPSPLIRPGANVPPGMEISVLRQPDRNRTIVHLVNFTPTRRTAANEFIEAAVPVSDVQFSLRTEKAPARVTLAPQGHTLPFDQTEDYCAVTVPIVHTHQVVVFEGPI